MPRELKLKSHTLLAVLLIQKSCEVASHNHLTDVLE